MYFKTRSQRYEGAIRNSLHMQKKIKEMGWDENGREVKYIYRALNGETDVVHNVFMKMINVLGTEEQIAKWMSLAMDYKILGIYAQTELGHGLITFIERKTHLVKTFIERKAHQVAVKIINKANTLKTPTAIKNLQREIKIQKMIQHPNIVPLYEAYETGSSYYLVMELCEGGDLLDKLSEKNKIEEREAKSYIRQIVTAVEHLHRKGIVHRDIKLENILLDDESNIKLVDFGLSNTISYYGLCPQPLRTQCGTRAYAAPELLMGKPYDAKVDVWSMERPGRVDDPGKKKPVPSFGSRKLMMDSIKSFHLAQLYNGVTVYAMLTGQFPYNSELNIGNNFVNQLKDRQIVFPTELSKVKVFISALNSLTDQPDVKAVLKRLCDLYALHGIVTSAGDFLQHGYLSGKQLDVVTTAYLSLLAELWKDAVLLVDAFDFTDEQLLSALGMYDGNVYHSLLEWAQKNPENKKVKSERDD
ncbi:hormonally up-regulated neu tumor-associated kinase-like [Eleutherodactylus coqui]|uniref:hormonally up-regulated neu tumor-associated kinase-like n=1 Tax=Eleutherodactylus coqui TaxID=57060 RepID=UPI003462D84A